jgi:hypothetical protein
VKGQKNDIVDVVPSTKVLMKKYAKRSNYRTVASMNTYSLVANVMNPFQTWTDVAAEGPFDSGRVTLYKPFYNRLPLADVFEGARGGYTVRIETSYARDYRADTNPQSVWLPFCLWLNGPNESTTGAVYGPLIAQTLEKYYLNDWNDSTNVTSTPYIIQPINPTVNKEGSPVVFEVDCPYQHIYKYGLMSPAPTQQIHGLLVWGWYNPTSGEIQGETPAQFYSQVFQKISDDTRLGLAESANYVMTAQPSWDAAILPVVA